MPNAFTLGFGGRGSVRVTSAGIRTFNDDELAGLLAHELGHVHHRDSLRGLGALGLASLGAVAALAIYWPLSLLWCVAAVFCLQACRRRSEWRADAYAAHLGLGPELMSALRVMALYPKQPESRRRRARRRIEEGIGRRLGLHATLSSHPPTSARLARLTARDSALLVRPPSPRL